MSVELETYLFHDRDYAWDVRVINRRKTGFNRHA